MITKAMSGKGSDFYQTPSYAVDILVPFLNKELKIWEPANGHGAISNRLIEWGFNVVGSDIKDGTDFINDDAPYSFDMVVTNPPFSMKYEFIKRCYEYGKPFALLMPLSALETPDRQGLFDEYGIELIIPDRRVRYIPFGSEEELPRPAYLSCWFTCGLADNVLNFVKMERN